MLGSQVLIETTGCGQNQGQGAVGEGVPTPGEGAGLVGSGLSWAHAVGLACPCSGAHSGGFVGLGFASWAGVCPYVY